MDSEMRCPLCGEANECGVALGKEDCWCFATAVPGAVLDGVPESECNMVCICQKCAALRDTGDGSGAQPADPSPSDTAR